VTRLGRRRWEWPILKRFTSFMKKLAVFKHARNFVGTRTRIDDFSTEIRRIQSGLIAYLKGAKEKGYRAFLKMDKIAVNSLRYNM
jgi:hypothetical protein